MNRALPNTNNNNNMLHCLNTSGNLSGNCSDMKVLERQRARMKLQHHHQQHHLQQQQTYFSATGSGGFNGLFSPDLQLQSCQGLMIMGGGGNSALAEVVANAHSMKPDPGLDNGWPELGFGSSGLITAAHAPGFDMNSAISRTSSCPPSVVAAAAVSEAKGGRELVPSSEKLSSASGRESFRKRKADKVQNTKVVAENDSKDKRIRVSAEEGESKITEQNSTKNTATTANNNNNKAPSAETSKENSKASEVQKPDYIHVRARRGQATDSHSLAERVRREKISERMKYLQDLVPGCNKITGKAGMLDEIINYVQSLQRQVEFLSMKLAAVNPRLDFNTDDLFSKEAFPPCAPSFPTIGMSTEMTNQAYLQFNSAQQIVSCSGLDMGVNPSDMGLRRSITAPVSMPEMFLDPSCFTQMLPSTAWETDLQNLYHVGFDHQARSASVPTQPFTGAVEASNLKMEM